MGYIFLSYASEDVVKARRIAELLRAMEFEVWFDETRLRPGWRWDDEIRTAIEHSVGAVFVISENSVSKDSYVRTELELLLDRADQRPLGKPYLLPVKIDECAVDFSRLAKYQHVEFQTKAEPRSTALLLKLDDLHKIIESGEWEKDKKRQISIAPSKQAVEEKVAEIAKEKKQAEYSFAPGTSEVLFRPEELDLYVNKITHEAYIFFGKEIDMSIARVLYYKEDHSVAVEMQDGRRYDLGVKIQWLVRPHFVRAREVGIVRTRNGETIEGVVAPFVHADGDDTAQREGKAQRDAQLRKKKALFEFSRWWPSRSKK